MAMLPNSYAFRIRHRHRIRFGPGTLREVGARGARIRSRAFVVTGREGRRAEQMLDLLAAEGIAATTFAVAGEPTVDAVIAATAEARRQHWRTGHRPGRRQPIDAAKAVSAVADQSGRSARLSRGGRESPTAHRPAAPLHRDPHHRRHGRGVTPQRGPHVASPSGQGQLAQSAHAARLALVDPELTVDLPPGLTANTGLDALTQLIEPYVSCRANPLSDGFCTEGSGASPAHCARHFTTVRTPQPARTWRWRASAADSHWPMPVWAPSTVSLLPLAACSLRRTGPCARVVASRHGGRICKRRVCAQPLVRFLAVMLTLRDF